MVEYLIQCTEERCTEFVKHEISCLIAPSVLTNDLFVANEFGNEKIISQFVRIIKFVTKGMTGCLRMTKDTIFSKKLGCCVVLLNTEKYGTLSINN